MTREGPKAWHEFIEFLSDQDAVAPLWWIPALTWGTELKDAACHHTFDQGPLGIVGHKSSNRDSFPTRVRKYVPDVRIAENIHYGKFTAKEVVIALGIDDGVSSRGHRTILTGSHLMKMGSCNGPHKTYGEMTTIDYSGWCLRSRLFNLVLVC